MNPKKISRCLVFMILFQQAFFLPRAVSAGEEQALIITIPFQSGKDGSAEERKRLFALGDQVSAAIEGAGAGEYDGNELGEGAFTMYMYGPSAERLFSVVRPILKKFRPPAGSYIVKRYGKPGSKQDRVAIDDATRPKQLSFPSLLIRLLSA